MFQLVSYKWFKITQYITSIGLFYKEVGSLWRVSDCEELVFWRTLHIPRFVGVLQECGDFTWRVSDCEELVGLPDRIDADP